VLKKDLFLIVWGNSDCHTKRHIKKAIEEEAAMLGVQRYSGLRKGVVIDMPNVGGNNHLHKLRFRGGNKLLRTEGEKKRRHNVRTHGGIGTREQ